MHLFLVSVICHHIPVVAFSNFFFRSMSSPLMWKQDNSPLIFYPSSYCNFINPKDPSHINYN